MSTGSASSVGSLLNQNPINLTEKEWAQVALSGQGAYTPVLKSDNEFHLFGPGPKLRVDDKGHGDLTGHAGTTEGFMVQWSTANKAIYEKKAGRTIDDLPQNSLGTTRQEVLDKLSKNTEQEKKGRDLDYILISTGALHPWAKQLSDIIKKVDNDSKVITNYENLRKDIGRVVNERPILKVVIDKIWHKDMKSGKMARVKYDKLKDTYIDGDFK